MFVAVWVLYAADRLLDARSTIGLEARHLFHRRHKAAFRWGIVAGCGVLAVLVPRMMTAVLQLDLVLGALLVGWFVVIHSGEKPLPKEFVVGMFFAAAVFVPVVARRPYLLPKLVLPAILFSGLCCLNCLFIFAWEHEGLVAARSHRFTLVAAERVLWLGAALAFICFFFDRGPIAQATSLSAALLVSMHLLRDRLRRTTMRALADLILLTPLVVRWWR